MVQNVGMIMLFIFDLYLDFSCLEIIDLFLCFLCEQVFGVDVLYIFGDLFEVWIGDDMFFLVVDVVVDVLKVLFDGGVFVYFIRGNCDFLFGEDYVCCVGLCILFDLCVIELYGCLVLLQYGDLLCIDDIFYQQFCVQICDLVFQVQFLLQLLVVCIVFVQKVCEVSQVCQLEMKQGDCVQFEIVIDVVLVEVDVIFVCYGVDIMIYGYIYCLVIYMLQVGGCDCICIVFGDWYEQGLVLCVDVNGWLLDILFRG